MHIQFFTRNVCGQTCNWAYSNERSCVACPFLFSPKGWWWVARTRVFCATCHVQVRELCGFASDHTKTGSNHCRLLSHCTVSLKMTIIHWVDNSISSKLPKTIKRAQEMHLLKASRTNKPSWWIQGNMFHPRQNLRALFTRDRQMIAARIRKNWTTPVLWVHHLVSFSVLTERSSRVSDFILWKSESTICNVQFIKIYFWVKFIQMAIASTFITTKKHDPRGTDDCSCWAQQIVRD